MSQAAGDGSVVGPRPGPVVVVLVGESSSGKTTSCVRAVDWARRNGLSVGGVVTLPRFDRGRRVGFDVQDVRTGQREALGEIRDTDGPSIGRWRFHAEGIALGAATVRTATPCDLLVVDELGPLELVQQAGWVDALAVLQAMHYRLALVAVRPSLLQCVLDHLKNVTSIVVRIEETEKLEGTLQSVLQEPA